MCDYSLAYFPNRLAVGGERLAVHRFPCGTLGLAAARRSWKQILLPATTCAVCVPPGARLLLEDIPAHLQRELEIGPRDEVRFVQQSAEEFTHRDGVRFSNGREVLLQRLQAGQRVRVISLGPDDGPRTNSDRHPQHLNRFAVERERP